MEDDLLTMISSKVDLDEQEIVVTASIGYEHAFKLVEYLESRGYSVTCTAEDVNGNPGFCIRASICKRR